MFEETSGRRSRLSKATSHEKRMECEEANEPKAQRRRDIRARRRDRNAACTKAGFGETSGNQERARIENRRARSFSTLFHANIEDIVAQLKEGQLDFKTTISLGLFPLHEAVACGLLDCAKSLIELGAELTQETPDGLTPLEVAVMAGNFDAAALLIQHGAPVDRIRDGMPIAVR